MHFTVLSAIPLPQDISAALSTVPAGNMDNFTARKLILGSPSGGSTPAAQKPPPSMTGLERWECFVEDMVSSLLAPYSEDAADIAHVSFDDRTEEGRQTYEQGGIDCVRTPDGRIIGGHSYEFSKRYKLHDGNIGSDQIKS